MRNAVTAALALTVASLFACGGGSSGGTCGSACNGCCLGTQCMPGGDPSSCGTGSKNCAVCTSGQACQAGLCTASSDVGGKCAASADCGTTLQCAPNVPGGGYCTLDCRASTVTCPGNAACITAGSSKLCLETCTSDANCRAEHLCLAAGAGVSVCLPKCAQDSDCGSANCDPSTGRCGASRIGNSCTTATVATDCGQQPAFCDTTVASGYCSISCGGDQSSPCPAGSNCSSVGGSSVCLKACSGAADCRSGFLCVADAGGVKSCAPACSGNAQCAVGKKCDKGSGTCVDGGPSAGQLGGSCGAAGDCTAGVGAGAICASPADGYPNGYCSISCNVAACPSTGTCVTFGVSSNFCLSKCTAAADCRPGYFCYALGGAFGSVCTPKCTKNTDCSSPQVCDTSGGSCVDPGSGGGSSTVEKITMATGVAVHTNSLTAPIPITIPADAVSVDFIGSAADPTARIVVYRITAPDGSVLYDYASVSSTMKVLPPSGPGAYSVLVPNSPNVPFGAGKYSIQLLASKETSADAFGLIKHSPSQALVSGSIDMNLFFVGLSNLNAGSAPNDPNFQTMLNSVKTIWAQVGISIGNVHYVDITGANASQYSDLKEPDLGALMKLSNASGAVDNALNVFFVHSITSADTLAGYIILGESAGIPGVPVRGTSGSGLAVTTADFPNGLADIADTWVHEGSHWLGLFHTTESGGTSFDPIPDTAECPKATYDTDGNGIMEPGECVGHGADNELFWTGSATMAHSNLTANQGYVMLRNPAVH